MMMAAKDSGLKKPHLTAGWHFRTARDMLGGFSSLQVRRRTLPGGRIGPDHVQMTKVNCIMKVNCPNKQKYFTI